LATDLQSQTTRSEQEPDNPGLELGDREVPRFDRITRPGACLIGGGFVLLAALLFNDAVLGNQLDDLGTGVAWFGVIAVAACAFSASLCLARWRSRPTLFLGLTLLAIGVYIYSVVVAYEPDSTGGWHVVSAILWPAIPLSFALWARTALMIVEETPSDPTVGSGWARLMFGWDRLSSHRIVHGRFAISWVELIAVWGVCVLIALLGVFPGVVYTTGELSSEEWQGWEYTPTPLYLLLPLWGLAVLFLTSVLLYGAWKTRGPSIGAGVVLRARSAPRIALGASLAAVFLFLSAAIDLWPEPALDLPIAVFVLTLAVGAVDAASYDQMSVAFSSIRRRAVAAVAWVTFALVLATGYGSGPATHALAAGAIAAMLPFVPALLRAVEGIPPSRRRVSTPSAASSADRLRDWITSDAETLRPEIDTDVVDGALAALSELGPHGLRRLLYALPTIYGSAPSGEDDPRRNPALMGFLDTFPALDVPGGIGDKLQRLAAMTHQTIRIFHPHETRKARPNLDDPEPGWILATYCLLRGAPVPELGTEKARCDIECDYVWQRAEPPDLRLGDGMPTYRFYDLKPKSSPTFWATPLSAMTYEELLRARAEVHGREPTNRIDRARRVGLKHGCEIVFNHWVSRLGVLRGEPDSRDIAR
jgi:hypothetical protein